MKVLVFRTSVKSSLEAARLGPFLDALTGRGQWNFDLDDRDRILRVVSDHVSPGLVMGLLEFHGFECVELEDEVPIQTHPAGGAPEKDIEFGESVFLTQSVVNL